MGRKLLAGAFVATLLVGCGGPSDITTSDVKAKEQQAIDATKKLNSGKAPEQGQGTEQ